MRRCRELSLYKTTTDSMRVGYGDKLNKGVLRYINRWQYRVSWGISGKRKGEREIDMRTRVKMSSSSTSKENTGYHNGKGAEKVER